MHRYYDDISDKSWKNARGMRREQTPAERKLWRKLRNDQLGVNFRRQHPIGKYIVDFVCLQTKLVVELDGDTHATEEARGYDQERTETLAKYGFRVLRLGNRHVHNNIESAIAQIVEALKEPPLIPPRNAEGDQSGPIVRHS